MRRHEGKVVGSLAKTNGRTRRREEGGREEESAKGPETSMSGINGATFVGRTRTMIQGAIGRARTTDTV